MKKLRCAVIGCGRTGCGFDDNSKKIRTHASAYFTNPTTKLVALCDIDKNKLKKYGIKYGVNNLYTKSHEMLKKENLSSVSICTLVDSHLDLVKQAVRNGVKGIFLEKPISDSLYNGRKIINICKKNNVFLSINHYRRFDPFYHSLKNFIHNKKLGCIHFVNVYYGSGIANTGSHIFDLLLYLFGEVTAVKASLSESKNLYNDPNIDVDLQFKSGTTGRLQALDETQYRIFDMEIFGTKGRMKLNYVTNEIELFKPKHENSPLYKKLTKSPLKLSHSKYHGTVLGVRNLARAIFKQNKLLCTGEDGYKSLELIIASHQSAKFGKIIKLPLSQNNTLKIHSR